MHVSSSTNRALGLQLYAASNLLGVGVFTLPFLIPMVGLLPALLMPFLVGKIVSPLYQRVVVAAHRAPSTRTHEAAMRESTFRLATPLVTSGGGLAAVSLGRLAAALRAIPTMMALLAISAAALGAIQEQIDSSESSQLLLGAMLVATSCARLFRTYLPALATALRLGRFWVGAMLVVDLAGFMGMTRTAVLVLGVTAGIIDLGARAGGSNSTTRSLGGLRNEHVGAAAVMVIQLVVTVAIAAMVVIVVGTGSGFEAPPIVLVPTPRSFVVAAGVALFALTGTGHVNIVSYPLMRTRTGVAKVVEGSVRLAVALQITWLLATATTVPLATLRDLDAQASFSTVGMAEVLGHSDAALGQLVAVVGAALVLFALSNSTYVTSESLAIEFTARTPRLTRPVQVASIVAASVAALVLLSTGISATGLLAVAGLGGGLLIIFVLPILAETDPTQDRLRLRRNQAIGISAACFAASALVHLSEGSPAQALPTIILGLIVVGLIVRTSQNVSAHEHEWARNYLFESPLEPAIIEDTRVR